jgi:hypothetical protein
LKFWGYAPGLWGFAPSSPVSCIYYILRLDGCCYNNVICYLAIAGGYLDLRQLRLCTLHGAWWSFDEADFTQSWTLIFFIFFAKKRLISTWSRKLQNTSQKKNQEVN